MFYVTTGNTNINGELITGNTTINGDSVITGRLDVGQSLNATNWINLHIENTNNNGIVGYMEFTTWGGSNCTWDMTSSSTIMILN